MTAQPPSSATSHRQSFTTSSTTIQDQPQPSTPTPWGSLDPSLGGRPSPRHGTDGNAVAVAPLPGATARRGRDVAARGAFGPAPLLFGGAGLGHGQGVGAREARETRLKRRARGGGGPGAGNNGTRTRGWDKDLGDRVLGQIFRWDSWDDW